MRTENRRGSKRTPLTAVCGHVLQLAQLSEVDGYVGIPGTEFIYYSGIAGLGSSITAVTEVW